MTQARLPAMVSATAHLHHYAALSDGAVAGAVARARDLARGRHKALTAQREAVLRLLLKAGRPLGAYELMAQLAAKTGKQVAPPTVYRALEFLQGLGLVSRIESSNEFLPCAHPGEPHDCMFLVCACCGIAREIAADGLAAAIDKTARATGFTPERRVVEIRGRCAECRDHG
ncbi:MAG: Fur family transcriptional regulator [Pseudomonadota bacterium]